jgi:cell division protein FtsA
MLIERLEESNWYKDLPFTKKPVVQHIQPGQVIGMIDRTGSVSDHTFITAMGLLRVGLDTLQQQDTSRPLNSVKERIDRILKV